MTNDESQWNKNEGFPDKRATDVIHADSNNTFSFWFDIK